METSGLHNARRHLKSSLAREGTIKKLLLMHLGEVHQKPHFRNEDIGTPRAKVKTKRNSP